MVQWSGLPDLSHVLMLTVKKEINKSGGDNKLSVSRIIKRAVNPHLRKNETRFCIADYYVP